MMKVEQRIARKKTIGKSQSKARSAQEKALATIILFDFLQISSPLQSQQRLVAKLAHVSFVSP